MSEIDFNKLKAGYLNKPDAMRQRADKAFGNLINPKRAAIQETQSAKDSTPVRKYRDGGKVVNEKRHNTPMQQGVRQDGKLYADGGKACNKTPPTAERKARGGSAGATDKKVDNYLEHGLYGRKKGGKVK